MLLVGQVVGHALVLDALHADTIRLTIHIFHVHGLQGLEVRQGLGQIFLGRTHHGNTLRTTVQLVQFRAFRCLIVANDTYVSIVSEYEWGVGCRLTTAGIGLLHAPLVQKILDLLNVVGRFGLQIIDLLVIVILLVVVLVVA